VAENAVDTGSRPFILNDINFMPTTRDPAELRADAEKLADILTALQRRFISNLSKELSRGNVSFPQYFLLGYLCHHKSLTMSGIAQKMGHTTAASTGLVDRLENLGLVQRNHGTEDRRKIMVSVTKNGAALVAHIRQDMIGNLLKTMSCLEPEEQKDWLKIYTKIFDYCQSQCK
jgi:DNA-binding MarR family transcriptional regulator